MKKIFKILFILLATSLMTGNSLVKSMFVPGWGEINEYNILKKNNEVENIEYIKNRSNNLLIAEGIIWLGLFLADDFSNSYKSDYKNYGTLYAGVNWKGKSDLFAAHVGNYDSTEEYNSIVLAISGSSENIYDTNNPNNLWDWQDNSYLKNKYDNMRNSSEQLDELKTLMIASLAINRIISIFDVIAISRQHGGSFSFDTYDYSNEIGLKINYNF